MPLSTFSILHADTLLRAGKTDDAVALLAARVREAADDHAAWHKLAVAYSYRRQFFPALKAVRRALVLAPDNLVYRRFKGLTLANLGAGEEAITELLPFVKEHPDDYIATHALQIAYCKAGKPAHAIALGRNILKMEDRLVTARPAEALKIADAAVAPGRRKLISFSLWGANPVYCHGALVNARLAAYMYPGWKCRFYLGQGVPALVVEKLKEAGADVIDAAKQFPDVAPSMWRFLVADDPAVSVFVCRDCDARLSPKDAAAVDAWLRSGKYAHVMRDHVLHRNLMLAGMWGARTGKRLLMAERIRRFSRAGADARYGSDQKFLAQEIWPAIRDDCLIHDSYYALFGALPFPVMGKGNDRYHVGMGHVGETELQREARSLGLPWPIM